MPEHIEPQVAPPVQCSDLLGRWFYVEYGSAVVKAKCIARLKSGRYLLRFRWGTFFRYEHVLDEDRILGEAEDPRWLARLGRLLRAQR